jgi:hypothetical protein
LSKPARKGHQRDWETDVLSPTPFGPTWQQDLFGSDVRLMSLKPMRHPPQAEDLSEPPGETTDRTCFSPWTNWRAWVVILGGVIIGYVIGFSPQLFILLAMVCLACGWFFGR